tara:strand:+ start:285 stop:1355 length:1071 start_codon:yes stop_codon:yes gene_type:complete
MKLNKWLLDVERRCSFREQIESNKRLDMSERVTSYPDFFWNDFCKSLTQEDFITYPTRFQYLELKQLLSESCDIPASYITLTSGSDVVIRDVFSITCSPGKNIVSTAPCFPMYEVYAKIFGCEMNYIPYEKNLSIDISKIIKSINKDTSLVVLANPNSPVGDWKSAEEISELCRVLSVLNIVLLIDEAYVEYSPGSVVSLVKEFDNLVITRTFSKALGSAGCRVGYSIASEYLTSYIDKLRMTFPLTNTSTKFCLHVLKNYNLVQDYVNLTTKARDKFSEMLTADEFDVISSHSNWIHIHDKTDNNKILEALDRENLAYKAGVSIPHDSRNNWLRLTIYPDILEQKFVNEILGEIK